MADRPAGTVRRGTVRRGPAEPVLTGAAAVSAYGRGADALLSGVLSGVPAFRPVDRFDVAARRAKAAATLPDATDLFTELCDVVRQSCDDAALGTADRSRTRLFLALHGDPALARVPAADRARHGSQAYAAAVAGACGLAQTGHRSYTSACVAGSTALADAAALIAHGRADRVVVAGGYLVDADQFALFDAGRALADDGRVRPFSAGRRGLLLGDGVAAVVVEGPEPARARRAPLLSRIVGWGRGGDAHHTVRPHPEGHGLARTITAALHRAGLEPADLGYVNVNGSGTAHSDPPEAAGLRRALGATLDDLPVSSTKSLHGQALEAAGVLETVVTVLAARKGMLPVNAGHLGPDPDCRLRLILDEPLAATPEYTMSLNSALGGANTALVFGTP